MDPSESNGKRCATCKEWKPLTEFHASKTRRDGRQANCKTCNIEQMKRYHRDHLEHCRARVKSRSDLMKDANRRGVLQYLLEHPCVDCGETDPVVLEFDHLRDKHLNVSELANRAIPFARVLAEIQKCEVVCANCHRRRTCVRLDSYRVRMLREMSAERRSA